MRLRSPSRPTWMRQSSATLFQKVLISSSSRCCIVFTCITNVALRQAVCESYGTRHDRQKARPDDYPLANVGSQGCPELACLTSTRSRLLGSRYLVRKVHVCRPACEI